MGDFAEARRRLIAKIEGCEETHKYMIHKHLFDRNVPLENYYRLNVDVGVGEFGMNEWNRLSDISTNTRRYLSQDDVQAMTQDAARKLGAIQRANVRWNRALQGRPDNRLSWEAPLNETNQFNQPAPPAVAGAFELAAEDVPAHMQHRPSPGLLSPTYHRPSEDDKFVVMADEPAIYGERPTSGYSNYDYGSPYGHSPRVSSEYSRPNYARPDGSDLLGAGAGGGAANLPPPLPPKTPIQGHAAPARKQHSPQHQGGVQLPYPASDGPPPIVNLARKPELR
jgi:hypothetical protein